MMIENGVPLFPTRKHGVIINTSIMVNGFSLNFCDPDTISKLTLVHYGSDKFVLEEFQPIYNGASKRSQKPLGGLWTCPLSANYSWKDICIADSILSDELLNKYFALKFSQARVILIDSYADLENLPMLHYPEEEFDTNVDWELLSTLADAVWLTAKGRSQTRLTLPFNLTLWDCETVFVMNHSVCYSVSLELEAILK